MTTLKIGTRGSALAMYQTNLVADKLRALHTDIEIEIVQIKTSGDWKPSHGETRLSEAAGGKGLFAKEIEQALLEGEIDCAVHSMKDMPSFLPETLMLDCVLPPGDERDALILTEALRGKVKNLDDLPKGAVVGTSSTRRASYILHSRPDIKIVPIRGNVPTRLAKVREQKMADATILACAGLERLGLSSEIDYIFDTQTEMMPAVCQGIICVETRKGDKKTRNIIAALNCHHTAIRASAARGALKALDGSCQTPIGVRTDYQDDVLDIQLAVLSLDGQEKFEEYVSADSINTTEAAHDLGFALGQAVRAQLPEHILRPDDGIPASKITHIDE